MTAAKLQHIPQLVRQQYVAAIEAGDAFFFESDVRIVRGQNVQRPVPWQIRIVPALLKKPKAPVSAEEEARPKQNQVDVFAPPYVPNLLVKELDDFTVLLNKYCVLPHHYLLVTRDFVSQEKPPSPSMLALVYSMITSHTPSSDGAELLGFFNCGPNSGASQPHCHFQLVELTPSENATKAVPIEHMLDTQSAPDEDKEEILGLAVPWRHFVARLEPPSDPEKLENYFGKRFSHLLEAMFSLALEKNDENKGRPNFNVLLTRHFMHLIPRRNETFDMKEAGWEEYGPGGHPPKYTGTLSVNALGT